MTAIMGLNGAGKTTLLRALSGVLSVDAGQVWLSGEEMTHIPARQRARNISYVAQDTVASFPFTVRETVMMGRHPWQTGYFHSAADVDRVDAAMARLDLSSLSFRLVNTLSGGERQRVMLARALAQQTPVILLDEPLNHLDIRHRAFVLDILREENRQRGVTIIAVLHELRDVQTHFDRAILLRDGIVVAAGPVDEVITPQRVREVFDVEPGRVMQC